jgi:endonuclease/exonuclease/phosphatase family metal-dependent hydrolase
VKILQYNIQFGQTWDPSSEDGPVDLRKVIAEIQRQSPDIVFLQEVEHAGECGAQAWPPPNYTRLKEVLKGYDSYFAYPPSNKDELPFGIGLAIFSRYRLQNPFMRVLPAADFSFNFQERTVSPTERLLIGADVAVDGRQIRLLNTHLQAFFMVKRTADDYPQQRQLVAEEIERAGSPVILSGDFNSAPDEGTIAFLEQKGLTSVQKSEITWHRMPYVLDHIFFSKELVCRQWKVVPSFASDHMPLYADLEWRS